MKKIINILLIGMIILSVSACNKKEEPEEKPVTGGWTEVEDGTVTEELAAKFDKAVEKLLGVDYKAEELLETQVVAGTNYKFLATGTSVTNPPVEGKYIITVYEDLNGNVEVIDIQKIEEQLLGGWQKCEDETVTEELAEMFNEAMEGVLGVDYEPVSLFATQVVSGTNYCFVAKGTSVTNPPVAKDYYVTIYKALDGSLEVLDIVEIE